SSGAGASDSGSGVLDAASLVPPSMPDLAPPVDLTLPPDLAFVPAPVASCPVPTMDQLYPGGFPPNPYAAGPNADACLVDLHDVIMVLGCPSNANGTPSTCQTK